MNAPVHSSTWSTAVPDWKDRIREGRSLVPDLPLYDAPAEKALAVFKRLRLPDMHGNPTFAENGMAWQFDLIRAIFGSYDPIARKRAISEIFLLIPKKNGKTTFAAAVILVAMILNERPEAEALLVAPTKKLAERAYSQIVGMIKVDSELLKIFKPTDHLKEIKDLRVATGGKIVVRAADTEVVTGSIATFILLDEVHEFALKAKAPAVMLEIRGSLPVRPDGFLLMITTQSKSPPVGVFRDELTEARKVRDGLSNHPMLAVLYELPIEDAQEEGWKRPETWSQVNPAMGGHLSSDFYESALSKAENTSAEAVQLFASQFFNVEVGLTLAGDNWPGALFWASAADPLLTLDTLLERSEVIVAGVDGGGLDDLFALALMGRERGTGRWLHWAHAWAQPEVLKRRRAIETELRDFEAAGDLTICDTPTQDIEECVSTICRVHEAGLFPEGSAGIGLDAYGISDLLDLLEAEGIDQDMLVSIGQGWKLQSAVLTLPRRLKDRRMVHAGQGLMAWSVGNAKSELKGSNWIVTKQASGSAKIDPLMATFNASILISGHPEARGSIDEFLRKPVMVI